ncbi:PAS domain-containing protein [uncultured Anaerotruncus sp.]|uniref:helix-turn-helix transcriptional regulator n=1 Tax=uncultured Anaerotruncus sp. TaxID=905011 RepID=UPI00280ADE0D|nr:PAS domain-containing protein [uncultured Anaerotruncus sp.]
MEKANIVLTPVDKIILESCKTVVDGLADYLGDGYEFVLHSLENLDQSVVKIINGHYTGRKEGAPITDLALNMLSRIEADGDRGYISYRAKNKKGEPLKATTIIIKGEGGRAIGLLCINFYLNTPFSRIIDNFVEESQYAPNFIKESYASDPDELLRQATVSAKERVNVDANIIPSQKNKEIISILYSQGIFKLKDSVIKIADILGISKNTVYLHLRALQQKK